MLRRYERITFDKESITVPGKPLAEFVCPGPPAARRDHRPGARAPPHAAARRARSSSPRPTRAPSRARSSTWSTRSRTGARRARASAASSRSASSSSRPTGTGRSSWRATRPTSTTGPSTPDELELIAAAAGRGLAEQRPRGQGHGLRDRARGARAPRGGARAHARPRSRWSRPPCSDRLTKEINYWDHRADQLKDKELAGKGAKGHLNSGIARQRAEELAERLKRRLEELEQERQISAQQPVIVGGALVVPAGYLASSRAAERPARPPIDTTVTERIAVDAVMATERELGREPEEQDHFNPGFDILSKDPITGELLLHRGQGPRRGRADRHCHANGDPDGAQQGRQDSSWRSSRSRMERPPASATWPIRSRASPRPTSTRRA